MEKRAPKLPKDGLLLSGDGIFYTIQGEGPSIGCPAVFIRLHMCNLECHFRNGEICDAWYTWKKDSAEYWTEHYVKSYEEIIEEIKKYECNRIVITGGEPLLQLNNVFELMYRSPQKWCWEIETNGTIPLPDKAGFSLNLQINCSPKLSNSGNRIERSVVSKAIESINNYLKDSFFKFVVSDEEDLEEVIHFVHKFNIKKEKIILMPEGTNPDKLAEKTLFFAERAKTLGWRLTPRLQCMIWGNKRGV